MWFWITRGREALHCGHKLLSPMLDVHRQGCEAIRRASMRIAGLFILIFVLVSTFAVAGQNSMGIADSYQVSFSQSFRVADTLLPQGTYEIRHVMEGDNHIMV